MIVTQTVKVTNPTIVDVVLTSDLLLDDIEIRIETDTGNVHIVISLIFSCEIAYYVW